MVCMRAFVCFAASVASSVAELPPGTKAGLYGEAVAQAAYTLNLHPPAEDPSTVEASLDALMGAENAKRQHADELYSAKKQEMLDAEKRAIREIVLKSFASWS